jgi:hypothetical protein
VRGITLKVAGLLLAPLVGLASVAAADLGGKPAKEEGGCGKHGTSVAFVDTPSEAARQARKEEKLVFILHVSGYFEDPKLT